jgi:hypothetical protein
MPNQYTRNPKTMADRFWAKVDRSGGPDACWPWRGYIPKGWGGYGRFWTSSGNKPAHRVAYELLHGPLPEGVEACHSCDNPPCCNGRHLFPGTHAQNMADMSQKGRAATGGRNFLHCNPERRAHGEHVFGARLTADDVLTIRARRAADRTPYHVIAAEYGVSTSCVHRACVGDTWRHLTAPD